MPKALGGQLRIGATKAFCSHDRTAQTMVPKRPFQGHDERGTIIVFGQKVSFVVFHFHVSDALASTIKVGGLVGHFLVKSDDILHHGFEVAFHDEFAECERSGTTPIEFHPEGVLVLHSAFVLITERKNTALTIAL